MNKEKLIEKLEAWLFKQCPPEFAGKLRMTLVNAKETLEVIRELLEQLDGPKKVIVPACAEPWLEKAQYSSDVISLFSEVEYATDSDGLIEEKWDWSGEFYDWLANDSDTIFVLNDALRYGYEVENEPEWVVKVGEKYFHSWTLLSSCEPYTVRFKSNAYRITDKKKADALAIFICGEVEQAERGE